MEPDDEIRKIKDRSPRFPFISLEKALERAQEFYAEEKRGVAPYSAAAKHWRYSAASSGALQTAAALKSYGLLEGTQKSVRLTELALRILLDKRPESDERERLKRQAALTPSVAAKIYEKWPDGPPSEATLNHFLVLDLGFGETTAAKAVNIVKQNHEFICNSSIDAQSSSEEIVKGSDEMKEKANIGATSVRVPLGPITQSKGIEGSKLKIEHTHDDNGLDITVQFGGEPTENTYEYLRAYFAFKLDSLKRARSKSNEPTKEGFQKAS